MCRTCTHWFRDSHHTTGFWSPQALRLCSHQVYSFLKIRPQVRVETTSWSVRINFETTNFSTVQFSSELNSTWRSWIMNDLCIIWVVSIPELRNLHDHLGFSSGNPKKVKKKKKTYPPSIDSLGGDQSPIGKIKHKKSYPVVTILSVVTGVVVFQKHRSWTKLGPTSS